ncbi:MAG: EF-hand domain-containing protein [Sulfitobacter sp.]
MAVIFAALFATSASGQERADDHPLHPVNPNLIKQIQKRPGAMLSQSLDRLFALSPDGIVRLETLQANAQAQVVRMRNQRRARLFQFDLNGDRRISSDEIERQLPSLSATFKSQLLTLRVVADTDKDGTLSQGELEAELERQMRGTKVRDVGRDKIFQFDRNRDGIVTQEEIVQTVEIAMAMRQFPKRKSEVQLIDWLRNAARKWKPQWSHRACLTCACFRQNPQKSFRLRSAHGADKPCQRYRFQKGTGRQRWPIFILSRSIRGQSTSSQARNIQ